MLSIKILIMLLCAHLDLMGKGFFHGYKIASPLDVLLLKTVFILSNMERYAKFVAVYVLDLK